MRVNKYRIGDVVLLEFIGEFDTTNLPAFGERIDRMIDEGDSSFVFDFSHVKFINSAALGYIVKTSQRLRARSGEMVLAQPSRFVRRTLETLGLDDVFKVFDSVEAGVRHCGSGKDVGKILIEDVEGKEDLICGVPILFRPGGSPGAQALPNQVGRIVALFDDGLTFRYEPDHGKGDDPVVEFLDVGQTLRLKFRMPLAVKEYYFEKSAQIVEASSTHEGESRDCILTIRVRFDDFGPADREQLRPFHGGGGDSGSGGVFARVKPRPSADTGQSTPERPTPDDRA